MMFIKDTVKLKIPVSFVKVLLPAYLFGIGMVSCNDDISSDCLSDSSEKVYSVYLENGHIVSKASRASDSKTALAFSSEESFQIYKNYLSTLNHDEKLKITKSYGVDPFVNLFEVADAELEEIGITATDEADFRIKYGDYVKKYEGKLLPNIYDETDLTLYVPEDTNQETYIANQDGYYVIDGEVKKIQSDEFPENIKLLSTEAIPGTKENPYNLYEDYRPINKRKVNFKVKRIIDMIHVDMSVRKKMWYGWKNDPDRRYLFQPALSNIKYLGMICPRYSFKTKNGLKDFVLGQAINGGYVTGKIYTWTDITAEKDADGKLIWEPMGNVTVPKCIESKSKTVTVLLPLPERYH